MWLHCPPAWPILLAEARRGACISVDRLASSGGFESGDARAARAPLERKKVCGRRVSKKLSRYGMDRMTARNAPCGSVASSSSRAGGKVRDVDGSSGDATGTGVTLTDTGGLTCTGSSGTDGIILEVVPTLLAEPAPAADRDGLSKSSMSIKDGAAACAVGLTSPLLLPESHVRDDERSTSVDGDAPADCANESELVAVSRLARAPLTRKLRLPPLSPRACAKSPALAPTARRVVGGAAGQPVGNVSRQRSICRADLPGTPS